MKALLDHSRAQRDARRGPAGDSRLSSTKFGSDREEGGLVRYRGTARVLFAEDFDDSPEGSIIRGSSGGGTHGSEPAEPALAEPMFSATDLDAAREIAWAAGHAAGRAQSEQALGEAVRSALDAMSVQLTAAIGTAAAEAEAAAEEIARLLLGALTVALPALSARHGETEVRAVVRAVLPGLMREPEIVVRVSPCVAPAIETEIARLDPELAGRIRLVPADAMRRGDVRVTWPDGAVARDGRALCREIAAILSEEGLFDPGPSGPPRPRRVQEDALAG